MALHIGARPSVLAERKVAAAASKARNQKIVLAVLGIVLVGVVALELPSLLSHASGSTSPSSLATQPAATQPAATQPPAAVPIAPSSSLPRLKRLAAKDPFVPQVGAAGRDSPASGAGGGGVTEVPRGPAVRAAHFVAKDPFVPQVAAPAAASAASTIGATGRTSVSVTQATTTPVHGRNGFVVVVASEPVVTGTSAAAQAMVAAENAGLPDVKSSIIRSQAGGALDVYLGPYPTKSLAQSALIRALRAGYTLASVEPLPQAQPSL
jgi:hypothetical protein